MSVRPMRRFGEVTIANGGSLSDAYDIGENETLTGLYIPAFTSAVITLAVAFPGTMTKAYTYGGPDGTTEFRDGLTYVPLVVGNGTTAAEWTTTATTGGVYLAIDGQMLAGAQYIRVRSGTNAAAVAQGAARQIGIISTITG
jgi:hypothetical protein